MNISEIPIIDKMIYSFTVFAITLLNSSIINVANKFGISFVYPGINITIFLVLTTIIVKSKIVNRDHRSKQFSKILWIILSFTIFTLLILYYALEDQTLKYIMNGVMILTYSVGDIYLMRILIMDKSPI